MSDDLIDQALNYVISENMKSHNEEEQSALTQRSVNIIEATKAKLLKKSLMIQQQNIALKAYDMGVIERQTTEKLITNGDKDAKVLQISGKSS